MCIRDSLYCVLRDKNTKGENAPVDIIARAEDASKIQRIAVSYTHLNDTTRKSQETIGSLRRVVRFE